MAEYIEKQVALDAILREPPDAHYPNWYAERIKALSAADVVPVVHGRWGIDDFWSDNVQITGKCAACSEIISWFNELPNYCPNCGARMDGGAE